jgi:hypothetical protein
MAIFEDVNGVAHAVSTAQHSRGETSSEGTTSSKHNRDGSVETSSHTVTTRPDGKAVTVDTFDTSKEVNGTVYHTTKTLSDDGHGHRTESLSNSFEQNRGGAHIVQGETVTKQLGANEAPVDLSKALEERGTLGVTHDLTLSRETHDKYGAVHNDTVARHYDTVGNESRSSSGSVSYQQNATMHYGESTTAFSGGITGSGSTGVSSGVNARSSNVSGSASFSHTEDHNTTRSESRSGLSPHVGQSIENRLVSEGYSVAEARETVKGVSESLGRAVNAHTAGTANSVEFHKEGPVAVSMTSGHAVSSGNSVAISMDELKAVHESGQVHSLQSGVTMSSSSSMGHGASMEMSR